jgi:metal-sulfur cluster biosynthetic enzyme
MMAGTDSLRAAILDQLSRVIDPETGVDVVRMRLVEDLAVDDAGRASFKFRPSSALCPLAVPLAQAIQMAVEQVDGVTGVDMQVVGYVQADELTALIREAFERLEGPGRS